MNQSTHTRLKIGSRRQISSFELIGRGQGKSGLGGDLGFKALE